jgi:hypothetical protein
LFIRECADEELKKSSQHARTHPACGRNQKTDNGEPVLFIRECADEEVSFR